MRKKIILCTILLLLICRLPAFASTEWYEDKQLKVNDIRNIATLSQVMHDGYFWQGYENVDGETVYYYGINGSTGNYSIDTWIIDENNQLCYVDKDGDWYSGWGVIQFSDNDKFELDEGYLSYESERCKITFDSNGIVLCNSSNVPFSPSPFQSGGGIGGEYFPLNKNNLTAEIVSEDPEIAFDGQLNDIHDSGLVSTKNIKRGITEIELNISGSSITYPIMIEENGTSCNIMIGATLIPNASFNIDSNGLYQFSSSLIDFLGNCGFDDFKEVQDESKYGAVEVTCNGNTISIIPYCKHDNKDYLIPISTITFDESSNYELRLGSFELYGIEAKTVLCGLEKKLSAASWVQNAYVNTGDVLYNSNNAWEVNSISAVSSGAIQGKKISKDLIFTEELKELIGENKTRNYDYETSIIQEEKGWLGDLLNKVKLVLSIIFQVIIPLIFMIYGIVLYTAYMLYNTGVFRKFCANIVDVIYITTFGRYSCNGQDQKIKIGQSSKIATKNTLLIFSILFIIISLVLFCFTTYIANVTLDITKYFGGK